MVFELFNIEVLTLNWNELQTFRVYDKFIELYSDISQHNAGETSSKL